MIFILNLTIFRRINNVDTFTVILNPFYPHYPCANKLKFGKYDK